MQYLHNQYLHSSQQQIQQEDTPHAARDRNEDFNSTIEGGIFEGEMKISILYMKLRTILFVHLGATDN